MENEAAASELEVAIQAQIGDLELDVPVTDELLSKVQGYSSEQLKHFAYWYDQETASHDDFTPQGSADWGTKLSSALAYLRSHPEAGKVA